MQSSARQPIARGKVGLMNMVLWWVSHSAKGSNLCGQGEEREALKQ